MTSPADAAYQSFVPPEDWAAIDLPWDVWDSALQRLSARRDSHHTDESSEQLETLLAAAYNSGAIEGLHRGDRGVTVSLIEHALSWQEVLRLADQEEATPYVEAGLRAFDLALDLATGMQPIWSEAIFRRIHEVISEPQQAVRVLTPQGWQDHERRRGEYKAHPNHVLLPGGGMHAYAPVDSVGPEMARLVLEASGGDFDALHPTVQAAWLHHALTTVHPFQDGNGRVARIVASVPLLRAASLPLLVYEDQRVEYFDALAAADQGGVEVFARFVFDRAVDLAGYAGDLVGGGIPPVRDPHDPQLFVNIAQRVAHEVEYRLQQQVRNVALPAGVIAQVEISEFDSVPELSLVADAVHVRLRHRFVISRDSEFVTVLQRDVTHPVLGGYRTAPLESVALRLAAIHPEIATSGRLRLDAFVRRALARAVEEFNQHLAGA